MKGEQALKATERKHVVTKKLTRTEAYEPITEPIDLLNAFMEQGYPFRVLYDFNGDPARAVITGNADFKLMVSTIDGNGYRYKHSFKDVLEGYGPFTREPKPKEETQPFASQGETMTLDEQCRKSSYWLGTQAKNLFSPTKSPSEADCCALNDFIRIELEKVAKEFAAQQVAAAKAANEATAWRPIEELPPIYTSKEAPTLIMGYNKDEEDWQPDSREGFWHLGFERWVSCLNPDYDGCLQPTHWQPLPAPPSQGV